MPPIRVLQIGMTKNIGGLETYLMQQFRHLDKSKVVYDFVNITGEYDIVFRTEIESAGSRIFEVKSRHSNPIRHYWQWIKLLYQISPDYKAIVLNSNSIIYVFPLVAARFFGIPMRVIHSHNSGFEQSIGILRSFLIKLNQILLKWSATHYFACSQLAGKWMFGSHSHFTVIPNAIDLSSLTYDSEIRTKTRKSLNLNNAFVVGHIGRFTFQKNHEFLIQIISEIYHKKSNAVLLLIGDSVDDYTYLNRARELVKNLSLENVVYFLGMRNDVPQLMQAMDVFLLPSHFEGLPVVGIEAQAAGLPSFFSNTITKEVGVTNLAHFISLEEEPKKWADIVVNFSNIDRQSRLSDLQNAGYDINSTIKKIEELYLHN